MLNVRELTAIGNRWNLAKRPPNVVQNDGYRENDGYRVPAGYRVQHIQHNVLSSLLLFQHFHCSGLAKFCFCWNGFRQTCPSSVKKKSFFFFLMMKGMFSWVSPLQWKCWKRGRELSTLCCTFEFILFLWNFIFIKLKSTIPCHCVMTGVMRLKRNCCQ